MPTEVFIPKMTDHMEAAILNRWLVQNGQHVEKGQPILEVETDKASAEVEASASGIITGIRDVEGSEIPVGTVIAFILAPGETAPESESTAPVPPAEAAPAKPAPAVLAPEPSPDMSLEQGGSVRATPVARRIARELGIDLRTLRGSGPQGRVREEDVRAAHNARTEAAEKSASTSAAAAEQEWIELSRLQLITGRRMAESVQTAPQFALSATADVTEIRRWQAGLSAQVVAAGAKLTFTAVLVKICATALSRYPRANVSFEGGRLRLHRHVNIGVAIGSDDGLVVPVLRDADRLTVAEVAARLESCRMKAQRKQLSPEDLSGGTFTVTNLGMFGIDQFTAIINPPESAILAVGRARKVPVVVAEETLAFRSIVNLTLSIDHRSLDGVQGARLMSEIRQLLEAPAGMM